MILELYLVSFLYILVSFVSILGSFVSIFRDIIQLLPPLCDAVIIGHTPPPPLVINCDHLATPHPPPQVIAGYLYGPFKKMAIRTDTKNTCEKYIKDPMLH